MPVGEKNTLRFGPFQLDTQCGQLRKNGIGLKLQGQPVQILEILLEKPGELVTREELRQRLWSSDTFVDFDHSLNAAIQRLRQALGDEAETPHYIETIPKRGYRFVGEVEYAQPLETLTSSAHRETFPLAEPPRGGTHTTRRFRVAIITCGIVLVMIAGTGYWLLKPIPQPHIVASHALTKTGFRKEGKLLTDGRNIYFKEWRASGAVLAQVSAKGGDVEQLSALPIHAFDYATDISKDGSELLVMARTPDGPRLDTWSQPLPTGPARLLIMNAIAPLWTADGRNILFVRQEAGKGALYRANADGSRIQRLGELPGLFGSVRLLGPAVSPDGKRIRFGVGHSVWEATSNGTNAHEILNQHGGWFGTWSPDGKYYFFKSWDGPDLWAVADAVGWSRKRPEPVKLTFGPFWVGAPTISKDGKQIYAIATERHGELSVYDPKSRQFVPYLGGIPACYVDFSRDGQWITYVSFPEGDLWRSKVDGSERRQLTWPPYAVMNPRWSPDGELIVFWELSGGDRSHLGENSRIYVVSADGGQPMLLSTGGGDNEVGDPTWSPDGRAIAYSVGGPLNGRLVEIRILDLQTQTSSKVPGSDGFWSPRWSPDGNYLIAFRSRAADKLMLFSFATQQWTELSTSAGVFGWPSWTRDSKYVILGDNGQLVRIDVSSGRKEQAADRGGLRTAAYFGDRLGWGWFGLSPDDRPIAMRDTGVEEIYAFDLEYK